MLSKRPRFRLALECLEGRLALSTIQAAVSTPSTSGSNPAGGIPTPPVAAILPAPTNPTLATLVAFAKAYQSHPGDADYNPALDLNHNNQIAQVDGKLLIEQLPALSPNIPLQLTLAIAPNEADHGHHPSNSGGTTYDKTPTVIGHTTPGALVFTGSGTVDWKLRGPATVADAQGNFAFKINLTAGINQFDMKVIDAYGHQTQRSFPIRWQGFGKYAAAHPKND